MDKSFEVSSIHSETGLANNHGDKHNNMPPHITAAVSTSNLEKEEPGVMNQEFGFMAESKDKMDRQILVLRMGLKTQEETKL